MWHANLKALPLLHTVCIYQSISTSNVLYHAMLSHISKTVADMACLQPDKITNTCFFCSCFESPLYLAWIALLSVFHLNLSLFSLYWCKITYTNCRTKFLCMYVSYRFALPCRLSIATEKFTIPEGKILNYQYSLKNYLKV